MPVIGIDLGCLGTKVATVGRGGVGIVRNDLADRVTPTLVGYTDNERLIGDAAFTSLKSNATRTVRNAKHYLGLTQSAEDQGVSEIETQYTLAPAVVGENGVYSFDVAREAGPVSAIEVIVPFLKKIKSMSENYIGAPVTDCVLAIPTWFSDVHKQAALDACSLAGIGCHKVMQHSTATALDYGLFRRSLFKDDEDHIVVFIDIGYGQATVTVVSYKPSQLTVIYTEESVALGGRALDKILSKHLIDQFQKKTGVNLSKNVKALLKIEEAAEKAKKVLSANRETGIHLECLAEDEDLDATLSREQFEELVKEYLTHFETLVVEAIKRAGIKDVSKLASVEIVGGGARVPAVQATIEAALGRPVSRTLSADECVARGAAVQAAMLDPRHRVAPYEIRDIRQEGVILSFGGVIPGTVVDERNKPVTVRENDLIVFSPGMEMKQAASRILVLPLPNANVGSVEFSVCGWTASSKRQYSTVRLELTNEVRKAITEHVDKCRFEVKVGVDVNAMVSVSGQVKEEVTTEQDVIERMPKRDEKGEIIEGEFDEIKVKKPRIVVKTHKLTQSVNYVPGFTNVGLKLKYSQNETKETAQDNATAAARTMRNDILSKAFTIRGVAGSNTSQYEPFLTEEDRRAIMAVSEECEMFAEENDGLTCKEYQPYFQKLEDVFRPVEERFREAQAEAEREAARKAAEEEAAARKAAEEAKAAAEAAAAASDMAEETVTIGEVQEEGKEATPQEGANEPSPDQTADMTD